MLVRSESVGMIDISETRDRDLLLRLRDRDEDAFRGLFARYAPTAKALAQRVVRQSHLAEEIVQEAFMAVWRNPEGYDAERGSVNCTRSSPPAALTGRAGILPATQRT